MSARLLCALLLCIDVLCMVGGCSSPAPRKNAEIAAHAGAQREIVAGNSFQHVVYSRGLEPADSRINVYIGGDGRAFINRRRVALDPTVYPDPALQLMLRDKAPAFYIARPCYHGPAAAEGCSPKLWTSARYSPVVVASVAAVVEALHRRYPDRGMQLIGYSGGGVVALLVAAQLPFVSNVVTIAAPLDTDAWTAHHGYTPLTESLNPAHVEVWPARLGQLHLGGGADENVPPAINRRFRERVQAMGLPVRFVEVEGQGHCCWSQSWW